MIPLRHYLLFDFSFFNKNLTLNILLLVLFVILILLTSYLELNEAAYLNSNSLRLKIFLEEKKKGAKKAVKLSENIDRTLTTIWILNTFIEVSATIIAFYYIFNIFGGFFTASIITILLVALIINVFCKVLPKQKARINPEKIALENANIIYFLDKLLVPFTFILLRLRRRVLSDQEASTPKVTEEELESIIDTMETEGVFDEEDAELIQSAIGLNERTVYDIMTPRVDVVAIEESMDVESIKESFFEHQFSRVPVYKEDKDNIVGILSEKDFFTALIKNEEIDLKKLVSKPIFVSESTKVNDLIKEFQKLKKHFAIVVDEYGGTSGIVTMEDALEELVGEIYDEYDEEELDDLVVLEDNRYLVSPDMEIEDLFDYLNLSEKPDTQYNTIGGFVYSLIGGIPREGMIANYQVESIVDEEEVTYNLEFTIKVVVNKRIRSLELKVDLIDIDSHNNKDKDTYE